MAGMLIPLLLPLAFLGSGTLPDSPASRWTLSQMVTIHEGKPTFHARPVPASLVNPWPLEWEEAFQSRARQIIRAQSARKVTGANTYFENEKRGYGYLMAQVLGGHPEKALEYLQAEDAQARDWHQHTSGIDLYAAFTLKHQMRKLFYFGDELRPEYRQRMLQAGHSWTQQDPLRRPHHAYRGPKEGWGPDAKNSWVDVRSTENLFLMRVTSVYLMAEATENESTRLKYKQQILDYTMTLFRIGMGEWDSENYHGHSIAPLLNLHDFARDTQVKLAAKACLDWMFATAAVKYYQGAFNGPTKRDYNHAQPFGGSAPNMLWIYFGDADKTGDHWESDEIHAITSAYRPPAAVVELARKRVERPATLYAAKPPYEATTRFEMDATPEYLETQHFGKSFLMGSLESGTTPGPSDVNGFKITVQAGRAGAVAIHGVPGPDPGFAGSPMYQPDKVSGPNKVAQWNHAALWLVQAEQSPWHWVIPGSLRTIQLRQATAVEAAQTWVVFFPIGNPQLKEDVIATGQMHSGKKPRFPDHYVLSSRGAAGHTYHGWGIIALEKTELPDQRSLQNWVNACELDASRLAQGAVVLRMPDQVALGFHWQDGPATLGVWKNGQRHDWQEHASYLFRSPETSIIDSKWGSATLRVQSLGYQFEAVVNEQGAYSFHNSSRK